MDVEPEMSNWGDVQLSCRPIEESRAASTRSLVIPRPRRDDDEPETARRDSRRAGSERLGAPLTRREPNGRSQLENVPNKARAVGHARDQSLTVGSKDHRL